MTVPIIAVVLGALFFFLGLALLMQEKKDKKALQQQQQESVEGADNEATTDGNIDPQQVATDSEPTQDAQTANAVTDGDGTQTAVPRIINPRRIKLGLMMAGQGVLLSCMGLAMLIVHNLVVKIPWYISLPVTVVYLVACFVVDCLKMAPSEQEADGTAVDSASDTEATDDGITPIVGDADDIDTVADSVADSAAEER